MRSEKVPAKWSKSLDVREDARKRTRDTCDLNSRDKHEAASYTHINTHTHALHVDKSRKRKYAASLERKTEREKRSRGNARDVPRRFSESERQGCTYNTSRPDGAFTRNTFNPRILRAFRGFVVITFASPRNIFCIVLSLCQDVRYFFDK